jgi:hypothetical protein
VAPEGFSSCPQPRCRTCSRGVARQSTQAKGGRLPNLGRLVSSSVNLSPRASSGGPGTSQTRRGRVGHAAPAARSSGCARCDSEATLKRLERMCDICEAVARAGAHAVPSACTRLRGRRSHLTQSRRPRCRRGVDLFEHGPASSAAFCVPAPQGAQVRATRAQAGDGVAPHRAGASDDSGAKGTEGRQTARRHRRRTGRTTWRGS